MDQATVALVTGMVAAIIALIVALIAATVAIRNETRRREAEQHNFAVQQIRQHSADLFNHAFAIQHEIAWITWHANFAEELLDEKMIEGYHANVHTALPKLMGALAIVRSLSSRLYEEFLPLTNKVFSFEAEVAAQLVRLAIPGSRDEALLLLRQDHVDSLAVYHSLPEKFAQAMRDAGVEDWESLATPRRRTPGWMQKAGRRRGAA